MARLALLLAAMVGLLLTTDAPTTGAPAPQPKQEEDKDALKLPEGVIHVALPPGTIHWERVFNKKGEPLLRVSVGEMVIEARHVFIGDGKAATEYEGTKKGIFWPSVKSRKGPLLEDGAMSWESGTIGVSPGNFLAIDQLKPGSLYLTIPDGRMKFEFPPAVKGNPKP